jgi:hypothetical protein
MCETELIKLGLFLAVVDFVTLSIIAILEIEKLIEEIDDLSSILFEIVGDDNA